MAMNADDIISMIKEALPGCSIDLQDLKGDGDHYAAHVEYDGFAGLSRIKQHQLVYKALKGQMGEELHALALKTSVPQL
jgi:stress-induced morphogen